MNRERLEQMVVMLRNLPTDRIGFNLENWVDREHECGTVACAVGHACLNPVFNEQGLRLRGEPYPVPSYCGKSSWDAVQDFFGIDYKQATHLFADTSYPDGGGTHPNEVAERIEYCLEAA